MRICFLGNDERLAYLKRYASPATELDNLSDFVGATQRPPSVESRMDELELARWYIERIIEAENRGFDAVVTGCFGDPGVDAARERVRIPVIGPGETTLLTARMLAHYFSVITPLSGTLPTAREQVIRLGLQHSVASIRPFGASIEAIRSKDPGMIDDLVALCERTVHNDGAELLVFGCASMSLLLDDIADRIPVPVINAVKLSLKAAEMLVGAGLTHSPVTFPTPAKLARVAAG